jgi:hypothetical protein
MSPARRGGALRDNVSDIRSMHEQCRGPGEAGREPAGAPSCRENERSPRCPELAPAPQPALRGRLADRQPWLAGRLQKRGIDVFQGDRAELPIECGSGSELLE